MNEVPKVINSDTVSSTTDVDLCFPSKGSAKEFEYKDLCKHILKSTIRIMDACFLVPVKMYQVLKSDREDFLSVLGEWMDAFHEKTGNHDLFWIFAAYDGGYESMKPYISKLSSEKNIPKKARADALTHMADVTKLWKAEYITKLCRNKGETECWILRAYEITLSKIYAPTAMAVEMQKIITYLKACDIRVDIPVITSRERTEKEIFQAAANLYLLVIRLRVGIKPEEAVGWYKSGNDAFFGYRDQMLEEFTHLNSLYFCQSYERYLKMREMAKDNKNKYAAKEVGDILRLGMVLRDNYGNRVLVEPDGEAACEFYRICIDKNYIPAFIPAVKTGVLIDEQQQKDLLQKAVTEKMPEALAYHAEKMLTKADQMLRTEQDQAFVALREAVREISSLENTYSEKYVLKALLLQTDTFKAYNDHESQEQEFNEELQKLFKKAMTNIKENVILEEVENAYLNAGRSGFYEAEYRLGKLFLEGDKEKSKVYFQQGAKKGCRWCQLEFAKMCRQQDPEKWLTGMIELGRHMQEDSAMYTALGECWTEEEDILTVLADAKIELGDIEITEIYSQINTIISKIYNRKEDGNNKMHKAIDLCARLQRFQTRIMELLKKGA